MVSPNARRRPKKQPILAPMRIVIIYSWVIPSCLFLIMRAVATPIINAPYIGSDLVDNELEELIFLANVKVMVIR